MQLDDFGQVTSDFVERIGRSVGEREDDSALDGGYYQRRQRASVVRVDTGADQSIGEDHAPVVDRLGSRLRGGRRF
jgi:hypothetical protein